MIDLITGHQGMPHISAKQISDLNNAMMEGYGADKIMRMKDGTITLTNNDVFTVNPGYWRVNGYDMEIQQTETIQIERPTGNLKRYDDIYIEILRDIPSGAERAEIVKVEGSPASSNPSHPPVPTEPELTTDVLLLCIQVGYVYATSTYTTKHDDTIPYHYVSETEYNELLTHLLHEQYSRARMSSGNFAPIRVDDIIKLNTKGTWTHTDPAHPGAYSYDTYTLYSGNIVFQISSNELGLKSILVTTSSTSGYSEKLILFKGEVGIGTDNLWLPRNGSQVPSGLSAAAIVNGEEYSVGTGGYYVELPSGVLTELYIQATSGISGNTSFYPTIRYEDDPTYTRSYPPAPTNIMLWNEINDVKKDLLSEMSDNAPYLLRKGKGNLADIVLEGYSLPVNQLIPAKTDTTTYSGLTYAGDSNGAIRITGTSGGSFCNLNYESGVNKFIKNHIYYVRDMSKDSPSIYGQIYSGSTRIMNNIVDGVIKITDNLDQNQSYIRLYVPTTTNSIDVTLKPNMIDLTQRFGTDIADHIYAKEQASAGSGIAWIKSYGFFSKDYEPYNLGSVQSVKPTGRKVVGKNLVKVTATTQTNNGVTYVVNSDGIINVSGTATGFSEISVAAVKVTSLLGNVVLSGISHATNMKWSTVKLRDKDNNTLYSWDDKADASHVFDLSNYPTVDNILINIKRTANGAVSGYLDIQLEIGTTATTYEPYTSTTVALPNEDLRGILKRDGDNLYAVGDTDDGSGKSSVRFGHSDLGTLTWENHTYNNVLYFKTSSLQATIKPAASQSTKANAVCAKYEISTSGNVLEKSLAIGDGGLIYVRDSTYDDVAAFKTAMSGVYLDYELATPTTESSTPWQNPQRAYLDGTEEFIDERDVPIPVGNVSKYTSSDFMPPVQDYVDGAVNIHEHATVLWELPKDFDYTNLPYDIQLSGDLSQYDYIEAVICHGLYNNKIEGGMEIITFKDTGADTGNIFETAIENSFIENTSYVIKTTRYREFTYSYNSKTFGMSDNCYKITHKYTKTNPVETFEGFTIYNGSSYYYMLYPIKIIGYKYK